VAGLKTNCCNFYQIEKIKRVRLVRRADGYYAQFCVDVDRKEQVEPSKKTVGLDVGLNHFYTDSNGQTVDNPRFLRKSERQLKKLQRKVSKRKKGSANRRKAIKRLARKHLQVSRQRKDFAVKTARCVVRFKKSLSERTYQCSHYGTVLDRDHNAALNILAIGLNRVGHT